MLRPSHFLDCYTIHRKIENSDETILKDKQTNHFVLMKELILENQ